MVINVSMNKVYTYQYTLYYIKSKAHRDLPVPISPLIYILKVHFFNRFIYDSFHY